MIAKKIPPSPSAPSVRATMLMRRATTKTFMLVRFDRDAVRSGMSECALLFICADP